MKENMPDPDSFQHVKTQYGVMNNDRGITVLMTYRGKNPMGATVKESIKAQFDMNGNFIRWVSN